MKIAVFVLIWTAILRAEVPCNDVNLLMNPKWGQAAFLITGTPTKWNHYLRQMPLYDQGQTGICYAFSAIQLVDYWRQTMGIRVTKEILLSSPIYAAFLTRINEKSTSFKEKTLEGGDTADAIRSIKQIGMCRDDVIQNGIDQYAKKRSLDQREFLEIVELIFSQFPGDPEVIKNMSEKEIFKKYVKNRISFYDGRKINEDGNIAAFLKEVAPYIESGDIPKFINDLFNECQKPTSIYVGTKMIPDPMDMVVRSNQLSYLKDYLRSLLSKKNPQPFGVGYCSKVLENKNYKGRIPDPDYGNQMVPRNEEECGPHASLVVGMKNIGGKCHYLLRNTWGTRCDYDWQCRFNAKKEAIGVYIDEDALIRNMGDFTYLKYKDYLCMAKTQLGEELFEMDRPSYPFNDKNFIYIFNKGELILVKGLKDGKIEFLFGKDNNSLYSAQETDERSLKIPIKVSFSYPKKGLNLKMACIPNGPNRSQLVSELKKIISSKF